MVLCFGIVSEHCTAETCKEMSAGPKATYYWAEKGEKPQSLPAPEYIANLVNWISKQLDDEKVFPGKCVCVVCVFVCVVCVVYVCVCVCAIYITF